jgi:hypothetical protein
MSYFLQHAQLLISLPTPKLPASFFASSSISKGPCHLAFFGAIMTVFEKLAESEKRMHELEEESKRLHNTVAYFAT